MKSFKGIGGHHAQAPATVEWLTPPAVIERLGGWQVNDRDPCAPIDQPYPTARETWTILDDGLSKRWNPAETFFMNPPYTNGQIALWLSMLADHGNGIALIFARTETEAFFRFCWDRATALLFMRGRINFHVGEAYSVIRTRRTFLAGERADGNAGAPTVLVAYGDANADRLADSGIEGQFVPLIVSRSVMVSAIGGRHLARADRSGHGVPRRSGGVGRIRLARDPHASESVRPRACPCQGSADPADGGRES